MSIFEYATVAISIILGLGLAQLLSGALDLVRYRSRIRFHWAPLIWVAIIFWIQVEFWWTLFGSSTDPSVWTHGNFLLAVATAVSLIAAGGLILPTSWPEGRFDLNAYFHSEGKAAIAAFLMFHVLAVPFNSRLLGAPVVSWVNLFILAMVAVLLMMLRNTESRRTNLLTLLFLALQLGVLAIWIVPTFA